MNRDLKANSARCYFMTGDVKVFTCICIYVTILPINPIKLWDNVMILFLIDLFLPFCHFDKKKNTERYVFD